MSVRGAGEVERVGCQKVARRIVKGLVAMMRNFGEEGELLLTTRRLSHPMNRWNDIKVKKGTFI